MKIPVVIQRKICEFLAQGLKHRQIVKRANIFPTILGIISKKIKKNQKLELIINDSLLILSQSETNIGLNHFEDHTVDEALLDSIVHRAQ